jgi:hypothetical protein
MTELEPDPVKTTVSCVSVWFSKCDLKLAFTCSNDVPKVTPPVEFPANAIPVDVTELKLDEV